MARATGPFWRPVAAAAAVTVFIAVLGGTLTDLGPWYQSLQQPGWKPPDMLFGPAWTLIYACCVLAFILAWRRASSRGQLARGLGGRGMAVAQGNRGAAGEQTRKTGGP